MSRGGGWPRRATPSYREPALHHEPQRAGPGMQPRGSSRRTVPRSLCRLRSRARRATCSRTRQAAWRLRLQQSRQRSSGFGKRCGSETSSGARWSSWRRSTGFRRGASLARRGPESTTATTRTKAAGALTVRMAPTARSRANLRRTRLHFESEIQARWPGSGACAAHKAIFVRRGNPPRTCRTWDKHRALARGQEQPVAWLLLLLRSCMRPEFSAARVSRRRR